ncbi:MAG: FAD-binding oxidoreductase, partial [Gammaproteobacteria bacterium]
MDENKTAEKADDAFWRRAFFSDKKPAAPLRRAKNDLTARRPGRIGDGGELWLTHLFNGKHPGEDGGDRLIVYKGGAVVHEIPLNRLGRETVIGRHPDADLQLESFKLAMFHAAILEKDGKFYIQSLDESNGILVDRKKIRNYSPLPLRDGMQVDLPGYRLVFSIAGSPPPQEDAAIDAEELEVIPEFFYTPPPPPASPLLAHLVEDHARLGVWSEGVTRLKVADIVEETHDCKTFRLVGKEPMLFSYKPGQFITFILNIDGQEVKRSYSMSSSPSRPHLLEVTVKRIPGGLVSNWFCDKVKLGDELTVKGPSGKFTCFNFPSNKMLFVGAGSGITPVISMSRWITDTAADVDVKLLASFKTPSEIIFRKELEMLSVRHSGFQVALTVTAGWHGIDSWAGFTGRVSRDMINVFVPDILERHVFMCGPEPFAESVKNILCEIGYDMSRFHSESFGTGRSAQDAKAGARTLPLTGPLHRVTFARTG